MICRESGTNTALSSAGLDSLADGYKLKHGRDRDNPLRATQADVGPDDRNQVLKFFNTLGYTLKEGKISLLPVIRAILLRLGSSLSLFRISYYRITMPISTGSKQRRHPPFFTILGTL